MGGEDGASNGHSRAKSHAALRTSNGHAREHLAEGGGGGHDGSYRRSLPLSTCRGRPAGGSGSEGRPRGGSDVFDARRGKGNEEVVYGWCFWHALGVGKGTAVRYERTSHGRR